MEARIENSISSDKTVLQVELLVLPIHQPRTRIGTVKKERRWGGSQKNTKGRLSRRRDYGQSQRGLGDLDNVRRGAFKLTGKGGVQGKGEKGKETYLNSVHPGRSLRLGPT